MFLPEKMLLTHRRNHTFCIVTKTVLEALTDITLISDPDHTINQGYVLSWMMGDAEWCCQPAIMVTEGGAVVDGSKRLLTLTKVLEMPDFRKAYSGYFIRKLLRANLRVCILA